MVIHKLGTQNGRFTFSKCNRALHIVGGEAADDWEDVECKQCLKHRGDASCVEEEP